MFLFFLHTEKAEALTKAEAIPGTNVKFSNLKYQLVQGKWVVEPYFIGPFNVIYWTTQGKGFFGGPEFGHVEVDLQHGGFKAHAKMSWFNPTRGDNSCSIVITGQDAWFFNHRCSIDNGTIADAEFRIYRR